MKRYKVVLLSGDGIGPEISEISITILKKLSKKYGFNLDIKEEYFGGIAYEKHNDPAPKETLDQCKASDAVLLACVGDVKYDTLPRELRPESGLLKLREALNLFANIRPVKIRKSLLDSSSLKKEVIENVDLIVVRELIGGIYFGQPRGEITNTKIKKAFNTFSFNHHVIKEINKKAYLSSLAIADYIIVTCDSTSMISEAAMTGKPIYVAQIPTIKNNYRFKKFPSQKS